MSESRILIAIAVPNTHHAEHICSVFPQEIAEGSLLVHVTGPDQIQSAYRTFQERHVDAILSRGGLYQYFSRLKGEIPLIETHLSMLDILEALRTAEQTHPGKCFYLVLSRFIEFDAEVCRRFIKTPVIHYPFQNVDELKARIERIPPDGLVIGSGFVSEISESRGLEFYNIKQTPNMLRLYYNQARDFVAQLRREKEYLTQLKATQEQIEEGIVILNEAGLIRDTNRQGAQLLGAEGQALNNVPILTVYPEFPFTRLLGREVTEPKNQLVQINGISLNLTISSYIAYRDERYYLLTVQTVQDIQRREQNIRYKLAQKGLIAQHTFADIQTREPGMKQTIRQAERVSGEEGAVLLIGESGTGKELFAQSIHNRSGRKDGPFVAINCAALNESLLESELFGYVDGAFTGARKGGKAGLFELAHEGTIFLDEINSMPLSLQSKILRVLEERKVMRLGSDYVIPLDVRLISAANQDLLQQVKAGTFRLDLYYRLNTFSIRIPPLRQRKADIELLFRAYVEQYQQGKSLAAPIASEFLRMLQEHDWPGNVRELRNAALRFVAFEGNNAFGEILHRDDTPQEAPVSLTDTQGHIDLGELSRTVEDLVIQSLLAQGLSKNDTAKMLGISRQALYKKLNRTS